MTFESDPPAAPAPDRPGRHYAGDDTTPEGWYLTAEEAARYANVSKRWFYLRIRPLLKTYSLPSFENRRFYRLADLERYRDLRSK